MDAARVELLEMLLERSLHYSEKEEFVLASGCKSRYYIDCKATLLHPRGLALAGQVMWPLVRHYRPQAVGGMTLGADPITMSVAMAAGHDGQQLFPLIVRKQPKSHGTQQWIEGQVETGMRVVAVDDVFTTGGSTLTAIERLREAGLEVPAAIALIDREQGAAANFAAQGITSSAVFRVSELLQAAGYR